MSSQYTPMRHYYEDVNSYNQMTMLEDQIDGFYLGSHYWNVMGDLTESMAGGGGSLAGAAIHSTLKDPNVTGTDDGHANRVVAAKSKTLPEGSNLRPGKHQRSLSESKTTDVISLLGGSTGPGAGPGEWAQPDPCFRSRITIEFDTTLALIPIRQA